MARQASSAKKALPRPVTQSSPPPARGGRRAFVSRATKETRIAAAINLDGTGKYDIKTGIGFLDHMLEQLSPPQPDRHHAARRGRPAHRLPPHHRGFGHRAGRVPEPRRWATAPASAATAAPIIPMDETLTEVALDASNRPYLIWKVNFSKPKLGTMDTELFKEWFQAFAQLGGLTLHVWNHYGENNHHIVESCFKGLARALRVAGRDRPAPDDGGPQHQGRSLNAPR